MDLLIVSFDGDTTIQGASYTSIFPSKKGNYLSDPKLSPRFMDRLGNFPRLVSVSGKMRRLEIQTRPDDQITQPLVDRDTIARIFDATDYTGTLKTLVAVDGDANNWELECIVIDFRWAEKNKGENVATIQLAVPDPVWKASSQSSKAEAVTSSGQTWDLTTGVSGGNVATVPIFEIKPTGARGGTGMAYRRFVEVTNPLNTHQRGALNIANSESGNGLDTATLTTGKMQTSGDDLWVKVNGRKRYRWLQGMDTANTEIWVRLHLSPKITATLGTEIAATGDISTIDFEDTPANVIALEDLPDKGQVKIDNEYLKYEDKDPLTLQLKNIKRDVFGSSKALHTVGDTITWIEHRIWIVYGDTDAVSPNDTGADAVQPMFQHDSENDRHDYDFDTGIGGGGFVTEDGARSKEWYGEVKFLRPAGAQATGAVDETILYVGSAEGNNDIPINTDTSRNYGTYLGQQLAPVEEGDDFLRTRAQLWWKMFNPAGFDVVTVTGRKFVSDSGNWPKVELKYSKDGVLWETKWVEEAATSTGWQDLSTDVVQGIAHTLSTSTQFKHVALVMRGVMPGGTTQKKAMVEYTAVELSLATARVPSVSIGAELSTEYELKNVVLQNDTTGESISIKNLVMTIDDTLVIDCENRETYLLEDETNKRQYIDTDVIRGRWLYLQGGVQNTMSYTDVGTGNVSVTTKWNDRNN